MKRGRWPFRVALLTMGACAAFGAIAACGSSDGNFFSGADTGTGNESPDTGTTAQADSSVGNGDTGVKPTDAGAVDASFDSSVFVWPDCKTQPPSTNKVTLDTIWQTYDTATPKGVFAQNVYITAISDGACRIGYTCQFFVQDASYTSLEAGAHHAIKMFVSSTTSHYFTTLQVGDEVDVSGYAWRYTVDSENELLIEVNTVLPGCANKTGSGAITPTPGVALSDFSVNNYEHAVGPLLVSVANISGKYEGPATATFGLYDTGYDGGFAEAGSDAGADIVSLSPFFLPNAQFVGLSQGKVTSFKTIAGVFDLFYAGTDGGTSVKYLELGPPVSTDITAN